MAYRDDRHALEARAAALRVEIGELLEALQDLDAKEEAEAKASFARRAAAHPREVRYDRPSMSGMRPFAGGMGVIFSVFVVIALVAKNPASERIGAMIVMVAFMALFMGVVYLIFRTTRQRSVDAHFQEDGLRLQGSGVDVHHPWHEVERVRLNVVVSTSSGSRRTRTGYLGVRVDGTWHEFMLDGVSASEADAINLWSDWLLGVASED